MTNVALIYTDAESKVPLEFVFQGADFYLPRCDDDDQNCGCCDSLPLMYAWALKTRAAYPPLFRPSFPPSTFLFPCRSLLTAIKPEFSWLDVIDLMNNDTAWPAVSRKA